MAIHLGWIMGKEKQQLEINMKKTTSIRLAFGALFATLCVPLFAKLPIGMNI